MRFGKLAFICVGFAALSSCDKVSNAVGLISSDAEKAALSNPQFAQPIMLHIGSDAFAAAQAAAALNGVDDRPTYGAVYNQVEFSACQVSDNAGHKNQPYSAVPMLYFELYRFQDIQLRSWAVRQNLLVTQSYVIRYTHSNYPDYGTENTLQCSVITDSISKYLPPEMSGANIHAGLVIPVLQRKFVGWTYTNQYETALPGLGNVKMFAGTFTYSMTSTIPGIASGVGTASVKAMLNPDTGKWENAGYTAQDPSLTLQ